VARTARKEAARLGKVKATSGLDRSKEPSRHVFFDLRMSLLTRRSKSDGGEREGQRGRGAEGQRGRGPRRSGATSDLGGRKRAGNLLEGSKT